MHLVLNQLNGLFIQLDNLAVEQRKLEGTEAKGEARGKVEENIRVKIAKKMLTKNHSVSYISDLTGLFPEEILKL